MSRFAAALLLSLAFSASARAARKPDKSHQSELGQGMALFTSGDFRGALAHFNDALAEAHGSAETAHVHLLRGQCYVALSDEPDARRAFELAFDQEPDAKLDPNQVAPETVDLLSRVRAGLHADLTLQGEGASATLDGQPLGDLPIRKSIPIGTHELEVANPERSFDQKQSLLARPGDAIALRFEVPHSGATAAAGTDATPGVTATPADGSGSSVDLFGQLGALVDPKGKGAAFEAGGGVGSGIFMGSVGALLGSSPGAVIRAGVQGRELLGPVGLFACAEVPLFFTSGPPIGVGLTGGASMRFSLVEPYLALDAQHFLSSAGVGFPSNYFLLGAGVRVHAP